MFIPVCWYSSSSLGCRKFSSIDESTQQVNNSVKEWFSKMHRTSLSKENAAILAEIEKNMILTEAEKIKLTVSANLIVIPLDDNLKTRITASKKTYKYLVLFEKDTDIQSGIISELIPSNDNLAPNKEDFKAFHLRKPSSYDGLIASLIDLGKIATSQYKLIVSNLLPDDSVFLRKLNMFQWVTLTTPVFIERNNLCIIEIKGPDWREALLLKKTAGKWETKERIGGWIL